MFFLTYCVPLVPHLMQGNVYLTFGNYVIVSCVLFDCRTCLYFVDIVLIKEEKTT